MRTDKFKFIMDSMANHRIEETNSENSASFLSESNPAGGVPSKVRGNSTKQFDTQKRHKDGSAAVVEEESEESEQSSILMDTAGNQSSPSAKNRRGAVKSRDRGILDYQ